MQNKSTPTFFTSYGQLDIKIGFEACLDLVGISHEYKKITKNKEVKKYEKNCNFILFFIAFLCIINYDNQKQLQKGFCKCHLKYVQNKLDIKQSSP